MGNFLVDVTSYMGELAAKHKSLLHTDTEKHYCRGELDDFYNSLRSDIRFPCLVMEGNEIEYLGSADSPVKQRTCSFFVAQKYGQMKDYADIQYQMSECEQIGEEIVGRMIRDADDEANGCPFVGMRFEGLTATYMQNEAQHYVGVRFEFAVKGKCCLYNANAWNE